MVMACQSLYNFNQQAYEQLAEFEAISKKRLIESPILHADETGSTLTVKTTGYTAHPMQWTHFFLMPDEEPWP